MADLDNQNHNNEFLRELLGDKLYDELREKDAENAVDAEKAAAADPEDKDVKLYDKEELAAVSRSTPVKLDDDDEDEGNVHPRLSGTLKTIIYVACVLAASALLAVFVWACADDVLALTGDDTPISVTVTEIDSMGAIASRLKDKGLIKYPLLFRIYGWFSNADEKIEPGTYDLSNVLDYRALVLNMVNYEAARQIVTVVIPEGYEQEQIFQLLDENGVASVAELNQTATNYDFDYDFLDDLEIGEYNRLEGYLFPDTYDFYEDEDPVSVINKLLANFDRRFDDDMKARIDTLNVEIRDKMLEMYSGAYDAAQLDADIQAHMLDEHDIVIIASLIEKEAANNSERSKISSVIHNRLISKLYPTLEIDATIQYILAERKEVLSYDDLSIDSPYNTYKNSGLPIGPIANPGLSSLRAALYPDATEYYFYALDTDGTHHFSETSVEHTKFLLSLENNENG